jgi:5-hydroxyisourate hydrolase-like protein (transthyretin family)
VSDGFGACADTVPVKIQKKTSGHWKTVKSTTTSSSGRYRVQLRNRHGRYRSLAPKVAAGTDVCRRAVSSTQRH